MEAVKKIESRLEKYFKDLPHLPDSTRKGLADILPWLALIGGVLQLFGAYGLYRVANWALEVKEAVGSLSIYITDTEVGPTGMEKTIIYLGIIVLIVQAVVLLLAFPKLKARAKAGWDLLFLAALINVVYAVLQIFTYRSGVGSFIFGLIGTALALYLLFEVRGRFTGRTPAKPTE